MRTAKLQSLVRAVQQLTLAEQLELLRTIAEALPPEGALTAAQFRRSRSLDELLRDQQITPLRDIADLAADFWPEDESADDIVDYLYQQRRESRASA